MTSLVPTEAEEARMLMQYMKLRHLKFTHIKNETGKPIRGQRVRNWRAVWGAMDGVSPGFPDFLVIVNDTMIAIELKRVKNSSVSNYQKEWIEALGAAGIPARICRGAEEAISFINEYLPKTKTLPDSGEAF